MENKEIEREIRTTQLRVRDIYNISSSHLLAAIIRAREEVVTISVFLVLTVSPPVSLPWKISRSLSLVYL